MEHGFDMSVIVKSRYLEKMTDEEFFLFCQDNSNLRIERNRNLDIIIMPPVGPDSGEREAIANGELYAWNKPNPKGKVFSASTGYQLPDNSILSPDASWISFERFNEAYQQHERGFLKACPEFIIEVRSETDRLPGLQSKMEDWIRNGVLVGWLIDPYSDTLWIYQQNGKVTEKKGLSGALEVGELLPGFVFDLGLMRIKQAPKS